MGDTFAKKKGYKTVSCGCYIKKILLKQAMNSRNKPSHNVLHGASKRGHVWPEYRSWCHAIERCTNPKFHAWNNYGGRGIKFCERWKDFDKFYADMGPRPAGKSLDRYPNNDGNYEPGNCRWATRKEQINNRRKR